jgi:hypothetical protein
MRKVVTISVEGVGGETVEAPPIATCAPASLAAGVLPNLSWLLAILVPLQVLLAGTALYSRRSRRR